MNNLRLGVVVAATPQGTAAAAATAASSTVPSIVHAPAIVGPNPALPNHVDLFAAQFKKDEPLPSIEEKTIRTECTQFGTSVHTV
jgi:hypothetical protein